MGSSRDSSRRCWRHLPAPELQGCQQALRICPPPGPYLASTPLTFGGTGARGARPKVAFRVGRHRRGDVEQRGRIDRRTPLPSASSLPGGHATGVDSAHRPRTVTRGALTSGLRPSTRGVRTPDVPFGRSAPAAAARAVRRLRREIRPLRDRRVTDHPKFPPCDHLISPPPATLGGSRDGQRARSKDACRGACRRRPAL